jgi:RND family efflux transporter MFP subunit
MTKSAWLLAAALTVPLYGCPEPPEAAVEAPLRPVRIAMVANNGDVRERSFSGISQSTQESRMSFKVSGTIVELPVQVGDKLSPGDLIASLNPSSYELTVQQAEASLAQAQANQRNADANYKRVKGLYENNNASRNDLDGARANAESARAQVRSAAKTLEIAQLNRSYTRLTASADCSVAAVDVDLNENVNAGSQVARINCGAGIEISFGAPESLISGFEQGMPARVRFNAIPGREFPGEVTEVGIASGGSAATFPIVVALLELDRAVRPSMAAEVIFEFGSDQSDVRVIPASAVANDERGTFVYVAQPQAGGTAVIRRQAVQAGELTANGIEILSGLSEGDRVVTAGTSVVRDQQIVLLPQG